MIYEMTIQVRVSSMEEGQKWYETLLERSPDFVPHKGFAEWQLIPNCWLQVAEGEPTIGNGPIRLGVVDLYAKRKHMMEALNLEHFEIHEREEVPVRWATFSDPWGNRIGLFEYKNEEELQRKVKEVSIT